MQRIAYFQGAAKAAEGTIDDEQVNSLIQRFIFPLYSGIPPLILASYIQRNDDELAKFKSERRPGRPRSNREDRLKQLISTEEREFEGGFWIPDMTDARNIELLQNWNGEWTSLNLLKYVRLSKSGARHESSFPPKGQS